MMILFSDSRKLISKYGQHINGALQSGLLQGDNTYTHKVSQFFKTNNKVLMTTSCTDALELSALLLGIKEGDEIIAPSYTFVSTVNAFVLYGAKIKFIDIDPNTMNMNIALVEQAISPKTKAILPMHYAGVSVDMNPLLDLGKHYNISIIEDAAQGVNAYYYDRVLGSIGTMGAYSFHNTKNYTMGEGGALLINDPQYIERAEIFREKGTNRAQFIHGYVDKYTWIDRGSSFLPSDLNCALLLGQLESINVINQNRLQTWHQYNTAFQDLVQKEIIDVQYIPDFAIHNAHMYYIKCNDINQRNQFIQFMKEHQIQCVFHYIPLHSSLAGQKYGQFVGEDKYTTKESERLVRLPLWYGMSNDEISKVIEVTIRFFKRK